MERRKDIQGTTKHGHDFVFDSAMTVAESLAKAISHLKDQSGRHLYEIGMTLIEAKRLLPHVAWLTFLKDQRVGFGVREAEKLMAIARNDDGVALARLGVAKATLLLRLSKEERTQLLTSGAAETMSVVKLREYIKAMKAGTQGNVKAPKKKNALWFWAAGALQLNPCDIDVEAIDVAYNTLARTFQFYGEHGAEEAGPLLLTVNHARELLLRELAGAAGIQNNTQAPNKEV